MVKNQKVSMASGVAHVGLSTLQSYSNYGSSYYGSSTATGYPQGTVSPWNIPFVKPEKEKDEAPSAIFERWLKTNRTSK